MSDIIKLISDGYARRCIFVLPRDSNNTQLMTSENKSLASIFLWSQLG
ncbi:hypothetical protein [Paenibacillus xylanexedens]|nr:hypothetical protein [Paenibacillus xylanexedens]